MCQCGHEAKFGKRGGASYDPCGVIKLPVLLAAVLNDVMIKVAAVFR